MERLACAAVALCLLGGCSADRTFPSRPVVLICPWAAGGGTDAVARQIAVLLERELGVPVNVVNATGGAGVTGHSRGAHSRPDGYTITMLTAELNMFHHRGLIDLSYRDYEPLELVNRDDAALFVRAGDDRWSSLAELEEEIRRQPERLKASGTSQGGIWHVALAGWLSAVGLEPDAVSWKSINGSNPALQDLRARGVDMVCCSLPEARTPLEAGEIRCLGLMAPERLAAFPDVPTFKEQGVDWSLGTWRGLALARGVPQERVDLLAAALHRVVTSREYFGFMERTGFNPADEGPKEFAASLAAMDDRFGQILTSGPFQHVRRQRFGPLFFPGMLGILLMLNFMALVGAGGLRRADGTERVDGAGMRRALLAAVWVVLYMAVAPWAGFLVTAGLLLCALQVALGVRWRTAVVVSVLLVPALYQVFAVYLRVPLPWGWFGW